MSAPSIARPAPAARVRTAELVLAHMHLKLASLALARVELETLAGLGGLDAQGLVDLAEVRWRTGDLVGAGEAATAALRVKETDPVALIVAAEAASAIGRPREARRLASRAVAVARHSIDDIFAGMPRSGVWAPDANEPLPTAPTLFDRGPEPPHGRGRPVEATAPAKPPTRGTPPTAEAVPTPPAAPVELGFWDAEATADQPGEGEPDPAHEFEAGRRALVAGSSDEAALRFGLALRLAPALAPAILEATEGARAASLSVVRGDAYRSAGHDREARQAYAIAARGGLPERRSKARARPKPSQPEPKGKRASDADDAEAGDPIDANTAPEGETSDEGEAEAPTDSTESSDEGAEPEGDGPPAKD